MSDDWIGDPLVIDPPGMDQQAAWDECKDYVDKCGGLSHEDGKPNWPAAFGADPGVCSCPVCNAMYWAWGRVQRCKRCGFEYPTDWWCMYSWGAQARQAGRTIFGRLTQERYDKHKYYRWAFDHSATPSMEAARVVAWQTIFPEDATHFTGPPVTPVSAKKG